MTDVERRRERPQGMSGKVWSMVRGCHAKHRYATRAEASRGCNRVYYCGNCRAFHRKDSPEFENSLRLAFQKLETEDQEKLHAQ
jgi:hypothetical protein